MLDRTDFDHIGPVVFLRLDTGDPQIMALTASQNGNLLAVQTVNGDVLLWDLKAGRFVTSFVTLSGGAVSLQAPCLALSSDGLYLAAAFRAGSSDDSIGVWRLDGGDAPIFLSPPLARLRAVFLSPHGERLAVIAANGGQVLVYDVQSGEQVASQASVSGEVIQSADGMTFAGRTAEEAWVLSWAEGDETQSIAGRWEHADLSANGSLLALMDREGIIATYNLARGAERWRMSAALGHAQAMALSPDGRFIAAAFSLESPDYEDHTVVVWRATDGQQVTEFKEHLTQGGKIFLRFSPDGRMLAVANPQYAIALRLIVTGEEAWIEDYVLEELGGVEEISFSSDSGLVFANSQGWLRGVWDFVRGWDGQIYLPRGARLPLLFGGKLVATVSKGAIRLWGDSTYPLTLPSPKDFEVMTTHDTRRIELAGRLPLKEGTDLAYSPDGSWLVVGQKDGSLTRFDMREQRRVSWSGHGDWVYHLAFSPSGTRFASASKDGTLKVWDVASRSLQLEFNVAPTEVTSVAYSPDGSLLAMAGSDKAIRLLNAATGKVLRVLLGHTARVTDLAFSPDGRLLGSISDDRTIRLWDPGTGHHVWTGDRSGFELGNQLAFSPDGSLLATDLYVWLVPEGDRRLIEPVGDVKIAFGRYEWKNHLPVLFWPDGRYLSSADDRDWNPPRAAATWGHLDYLSPLPNFRSATFSPDGRLLAALSDNGWLCFLGIWR